ncbi:MAG: ABC transporter ATP-binding protein [Acidimicrobiia bacterium]|nr:ABC transporter ATP-binding protein [Acidimicrobiia bacterium]
MTMISGTGVTKAWGLTPVLGGVDFQVDEGITGLLGSNGAGKTTLMGMILGLHPPDSGDLDVLGLSPADAGPEVRARIGYSPEHHTLPPDVSAHDLVRHVAEIHGLPRRAATNRSSDALWQVGLGEERYRPIGTMSTGQRQRVKLAQAIAHDPLLVLADEPTDGLDPVQRDAMLELIRRVSDEYGISVLLSSHLLEEVERTCDAAVILAEGQVVAQGRLDDLQAGGVGIIVVVDDGAEALAARLARYDVDVDGSRLRVSARDGADDETLLDEVRDAVAELRLPLRQLKANRISLEEVFLDMSGGAR